MTALEKKKGREQNSLPCVLMGGHINVTNELMSEHFTTEERHVLLLRRTILTAMLYDAVSVCT